MDMDLSKLNPVGFADHGDSDPVYHYDGIRQDLPEFEVETTDIAREIFDLFFNSIEDGDPVAIAAGQIYEKKGNLYANPIGSTARSTARGSDTGDLLLQITVRVDYRDSKRFLDGVEGRRLKAEQIRTELEIADLERQRDEAVARLEALKSER